MVNVLKFRTLVACQKVETNSADPDQTASEEAVGSGSSLFAILTSILRIPVFINILFEYRTRKMSRIFEHVPYFLFQHKEIPVENTTDCLCTMANICRVMIENP